MNMRILFALCLGAVLFQVTTAATLSCKDEDYAIFARQGQEFPLLFRSFAGMSVTKSAYEERISKETGLSKECAACYGNAYICGWSNCKWPCVSAGKGCNECLKENKCSTECNLCTGFIVE